MKDRNGYKQQEVASNLDYPLQKRWVVPVVEQRAFQTGGCGSGDGPRRSARGVSPSCLSSFVWTDPRTDTLTSCPEDSSNVWLWVGPSPTTPRSS